MGYEGRQTPHGFRHIASTLLNNRGFDERHIESALAHVKDGVAGVYNKAQYLDDRANMMQWYANYLEEIADQSIIQFKKTKWHYSPFILYFIYFLQKRGLMA